MWSFRCLCEAQMHEQNSFITLTYNDDHLPQDGSISKRAFQLFVKRLREKISPIEIRFYGCGEYGSKLGRPHYHLLVFGYDFPDKVFHHVSNPSKQNRFSTSSGYAVYTSELLNQVWEEGFSTVGDVTLESAGYVARYIRKKIGGELVKAHYQGKEPEFSLMSRRPGIGRAWFEKYANDLYPKDYTTMNGKKFKAPVYFDRLLMRKNWSMYESIKEKRKEKIENPDIIRRRQKEKYKLNITQNLERRLEHE